MNAAGEAEEMISAGEGKETDDGVEDVNMEDMSGVAADVVAAVRAMFAPEDASASASGMDVGGEGIVHMPGMGEEGEQGEISAIEEIAPALAPQTIAMDDSSSDDDDDTWMANLPVVQEEDDLVDIRKARPPRTVNEKEFVLEIKEITVRPSATCEMCRVGVVKELVAGFGQGGIVVQALSGCPLLDDETIVWRLDRQPVGRVAEVFGPVSNPYYLLQLASSDVASDQLVGQVVYYCTEYVEILDLEKIQAMSEKGSDASNFNDEEVAPNEREYSDDEEERRAKAARKAKRKGANRVGKEGASRALGDNRQWKKPTDEFRQAAPPQPFRHVTPPLQQQQAAPPQPFRHVTPPLQQQQHSTPRHTQAARGLLPNPEHFIPSYGESQMQYGDQQREVVSRLYDRTPHPHYPENPYAAPSSYAETVPRAHWTSHEYVGPPRQSLQEDRYSYLAPHGGSQETANQQHSQPYEPSQQYYNHSTYTTSTQNSLQAYAPPPPEYHQGYYEKDNHQQQRSTYYTQPPNTDTRGKYNSSSTNSNTYRY